MAVMRYYEMPDQATQDAIRARGDTIEIVQREPAPGAKPAASSWTPEYIQNPSNNLILPDGSTLNTPMYSGQFATSGTAQQLADYLGGTVQDLSGTWSNGNMPQEWNYNNLGDGADPRNSGLLADLVQKYGGTPLLQQFLQNDNPTGQPSQAPSWATSAPVTYTAGQNQQAQAAQGGQAGQQAQGQQPGASSPYGLRGSGDSASLLNYGIRPGASAGREDPATQIPNFFRSPDVPSRVDLIGAMNPPPGGGGGGGQQQPPAGGGGPGGGGGYVPPPGSTTYPHYPGTGSDIPPVTGQGFGNNGFRSYSYPGPAQPRFTTSGQDIEYRAENDRNMAIGRGEDIDSDLLTYIQHQYGRGLGYENAANEQYSRIARGEGGYTPDEMNAIGRLNELYGLQLTPEQLQSNYLTEEEQGRYFGNPYEATDRVREGLQLNDLNLTDLRDRTRETLAGTDTRTREALARRGEGVDSALNYGETAVGAAIDPNRLRASDDFLQNYRFTPQDEQAIREQAGRGVGYQTSRAIEEIRQDAAARGANNPLAIAAALDRQRQTGDVNAANAMTDASIAARRLGLDTTMGREQTRLGAEQGYGQLAGNAALQLGANRLGAAERTGDANVANERYLGDARLAGEQALSNARIQNQQWGTNLATDAWRQAEEALSGRNLTAATNRQATNQANQNATYGRGMDLYQNARSANQTFADRRLGNEQELRNYLGGQQNQANQNVSVGLQQRIGNYGTQSGAQQGATSNAIQNYAVPGMGERIAGMFADGGAPMKPGSYLVGEEGPELVIDLKQYKRAADGGYWYGSAADPETAGLNIDPETGRPIQHAQPGQSKGGNPLYDGIKKTVFSPFQQRVQQPGTSGGSRGGGGGGLGGIAAKLIGAAFGLPLADGGVIAPPAMAKKLAPGVDLVNGPQVRRMGMKPEAVVPLTPRPNARVTMADLPKLAARAQGRVA